MLGQLTYAMFPESSHLFNILIILTPWLALHVQSWTDLSSEVETLWKDAQVCEHLALLGTTGLDLGPRPSSSQKTQT